MAPLPLSAESILYPKEAKNDTMRKAFKQKLLKERPETLFADLYKNGDVSNLIFLTDQPNAWRSAVCSHYPSIKKEGICNGWKLKIKETDDPDSTMITINLYKTGTVMVQGNIRLFETDFQTIKERAEREKDTTCDMPSHKTNSTSTTLTPTLPTQKGTSSTSLPTIVEDTPQEVSDPLSAEQAQALLTTMAAMRDEFTKLEGEVVLLRESVSKQQPDNHTLEELLTKVRTEQDSSLATQLNEVQQERDGLKRELADLTKERRDFHPATIQRINTSLSRDCALQPNVHLAHHPTLDLDCLYDHVHLNRETVPILAKTLKDVALNRSPTSPPRNSGAISTPPRSPRQHPGPAPWTPQPRPQHHQPQCPPQPAQHRPPQPSFRATQTRPPTPLPHTADPHLEEPLPSRQSYAQAVRGATGPAPTNQMSDIKQMLSLLCSHVIGRGSWMLTCDKPRVMDAHM
ncbi:uncharacterized protein ACWYII_008123 [Salvelinus alpinus]